MKPKSTGRKTGKSMTGETRVLSDVLHPCGLQTHTQDRSELLLFYWDSALSSLEDFSPEERFSFYNYWRKYLVFGMFEPH